MRANQRQETIKNDQKWWIKDPRDNYRKDLWELEWNKMKQPLRRLGNETGNCNRNLFVNLFVQEGDELQRAHASARWCKAMHGVLPCEVGHIDPYRSISIHIDPYRSWMSWMSWTFFNFHISTNLSSSSSPWLPSFKQLFVSFPLCFHLRFCIDRVLLHQEETFHSIKGCCILLWNARCKSRYIIQWCDHSDILRLYPTLLSPSSDYPTIRTGILPRSIVPFTGAKTSKQLQTPIIIPGTKSWNRRYRTASNSIEPVSPAWLAKIVFTERRVNCSAPAQDKLKCLREIQFLNSCHCQMSRDHSSDKKSVGSIKVYQVYHPTESKNSQRWHQTANKANCMASVLLSSSGMSFWKKLASSEVAAISANFPSKNTKQALWNKFT